MDHAPGLWYEGNDDDFYMTTMMMKIMMKMAMLAMLMAHLVDGMTVLVSTEVFLPSSSMEVAALGFCVKLVIVS